MIICYVKTDEICYALKYDCYSGLRKNVYLVKLNTDRDKVIDEYSETGEIIELTSGDVCRLYQGGDKVYLSINNAEVWQFVLPNSNRLQQNAPFEFKSFFVNDNSIIIDTEPDCIILIDSDRYYAHQDKVHESEISTEIYTDSNNDSVATNMNITTNVENINDATTEATINVTNSNDSSSHNHSKGNGIVLGVILSILLFSTIAVFVYFRFLKDKFKTMFLHNQDNIIVGGGKSTDTYSQKPISIKNESTLVANAALKYPVDRVLTDKDLVEEKDELTGKRLTQIKNVIFRYKSNHRDFVYAECFKPGVSIANVLSTYPSVLLAFSQNYDLIVGKLEKVDRITIKKICDYA